MDEFNFIKTKKCGSMKDTLEKVHRLEKGSAASKARGDQYLGYPQKKKNKNKNKKKSAKSNKKIMHYPVETWAKDMNR